MALGLTAGVYAGSLAAVSLLQIDHDRALATERQPVREAIELLGRHHDAMSADLEQAGAVFDDASTRYGAMAADLQQLHADVVKLSEKLKGINRLATVSGAGLGGVVIAGGGGSLPAVARSAPRSGGGSTAPTTSATTGASGAP